MSSGGRAQRELEHALQQATMDGDLQRHRGLVVRLDPLGDLAGVELHDAVAVDPQAAGHHRPEGRVVGRHQEVNGLESLGPFRALEQRADERFFF
jgi:hypothetical protein